MNLGCLWGFRGYKKAKGTAGTGLVIQERHYGAEHPEVAMTLINLGNAYGDLGDTKKKKELLERAW